MIGQSISHYRIIERLGEGGMGVVYRAEDIQLKRTVALKFLPDRVNKDTTAKDRFLQEAQAAAALNHPNICTIHGVEDTEGSLFIVMEYVEGGTLREKLPFAKTDAAITIAAQIGEALQEAHSKGIVHRDIKADNIMLTSKGQPKVMDFGLAKLKGALKLTKTSSTVGTLGYMAPEQIQGGEVDHRSDIFSFGVVLYEMLTGHLPFRGEHEAAMMYSILNEEPEPIEKYLPEASSEFLHIFNRALEKDPEDRYQSVRDMVIDLRRLRKDTSKVSRSIPDIQTSQGSNESALKHSEDRPRRTKKSRKWMAVSGLVILVMAVSAILLLWHPKETIDSLAVLPFSYKGDDPNIKVAAEEIPGELIRKLSGLENIKVRSHLSTLKYLKSPIENALDIGKELKVHAILTGSVELQDQVIVVTIELSDVNEGYQLWGPQKYKEKLSDLYLFEEKIAKDVTEQLRIKVSGAEQEKLAKRSTENAEAYKYYLLGLHFRYIETPEGTEKSISYFRLALEKDQNFALAWAGLAESYFIRSYLVADLNFFRQSDSAAQRAFELDPKAPETNVALGIIREAKLEWSGAEQLFRRAIELNPRHWNAHRELGLLFWRMGRFKEAEKEALLSLELDPLAALSYSLLGYIYSCMAKHTMAVDAFKKGSEIDFPYNAESMGWEYLTLGHNEQARDIFMKKKSPLIACYYAAMGREEDALKEIDKVRTKLKGLEKPYYMAIMYSCIGENGKALDQLDEYLQISPYSPWFQVDPFLSKLYTEPRFIAMVKKLRLDK